jgi:aerobic C4-dicarboxylate transport protein
MKKLSRHLTLLVLLAIVAGALLGHFEPATAVQMEVLGKRFIDIVKLFINPIIFLTITLGISSMGDLKKVGRIGGKALLYFEIVTTLALLIGVAVAAVVRPGDGVSAGKLSTDKVGEFTKAGRGVFVGALSGRQPDAAGTSRCHCAGHSAEQVRRPQAHHSLSERGL